MQCSVLPPPQVDLWDGERPLPPYLREAVESLNRHGVTVRDTPLDFLLRQGCRHGNTRALDLLVGESTVPNTSVVFQERWETLVALTLPPAYLKRRTIEFLTRGSSGLVCQPKHPTSAPSLIALGGAVLSLLRALHLLRVGSGSGTPSLADVRVTAWGSLLSSAAPLVRPQLLPTLVTLGECVGERNVVRWRNEFIAFERCVADVVEPLVATVVQQLENSSLPADEFADPLLLESVNRWLYDLVHSF
jgi:hypothetical protein